MIRGMGEDYVLGHRAEELAGWTGRRRCWSRPPGSHYSWPGSAPACGWSTSGPAPARSRCWSPSWSDRTGRCWPWTARADGLAYAATKFADRGVTNIELVEADVASYVPERAGRRGAGPVGPVLPAGPGRHRPAAARRAQPGWRLPGAGVRHRGRPRGARRPRRVTGCRHLMNAAFAAVGTPQTLGPHLAGMLREAGARGRPEPGAAGLPRRRTTRPDRRCSPAVIGEPGARDRAPTGSRTRPSSTSATLRRPARGRGARGGWVAVMVRADAGRRLGPPG